MAGSLALAGIFIGCNLLEPLGTKDQNYREFLLQGNAALSSGSLAEKNAKEFLKRAKTEADSAAAKAARGESRSADSAAAKADSTLAIQSFAEAKASCSLAVASYDSAMKINPSGSEAYLYHSQAILTLYHVDYERINNEFKKSDNSSKGLPFIRSTTKVADIDSIYYPVTAAARDLEHILRGKDTLWFDEQKSRFLTPDIDTASHVDTASDGRISSSVARLDLGILDAVQGLLSAVDIDGNGRVDSACGAKLSPETAAALCTKGPLSEVYRLNSLDALSADLSLDSLNSESVTKTAKNVSDNPNDIGSYTKSMLTPLAGAAYNLDSVRSSLKVHNETLLASNIEKTVTRVRDLSNFVAYSQYNDSADNDYDAQSEASPTPMLWHDFDNDYGIRFDYDDHTLDADTVFTGTPLHKVNGNSFGNPGNIGSPFHRRAYPAKYLTYDQLMKRHPNLDTVKYYSPNSRVRLMQKACNDLVNKYVSVGLSASESSSLKKTCDTVSSVLQETTTRPVHSEWISGTAGVDEELLDGHDNDYDGITDEDARNQRGYDDDHDGALKISMVGTTVQPMQWKDVNGNGCIDIDTVAYRYSSTSSDSIKAMKRVHCIGTLEHRLYLARVGGYDSLNKYYEPFIGEPNTDCLNQFQNRLDTAFLNRWYLPNDPRKDIEPQRACNYKHVWIHPNAPGTGILKNSEWTGGVLGVDEEICGDGIDNDGDGWVDEDCGGHK